jgi:5-hydroxyisourate hydrolase
MADGQKVGGISLHAVDVASGRPASGMAVELVALEPGGERLLAHGRLGPGGALDHPVARGEVPIAAGAHEARFAVGDWLRDSDPAAGRVFMEVAVLRFEVLDPADHVHLPLKFTRWGLALFRGS